MNYKKVEEFYQFAAGKHDFYRCLKCNRIFTQEYERVRLQKISEEQKTQYIHCTSLRYTPAQPIGPEWLKPSILLYAFKVIMARVVAPFAVKKRNITLWKLAMRLASNGATR